MMIPKPKVQALLKSKSAPSNAAAVLKQKKQQAAALKGGAPAPGGVGAPVAVPAHAPPPHPAAAGAPPHAAPNEEGGEDQQMFITELLEEAAQEAESGSDQALEDAVAGYSDDYKPGDIPEWVQDREKWNEAAQAVGLGTPEAEDAYEEPFVVAAYLYKKLGGGVHGMEGGEEGGAEGDAPADKKPDGSEKQDGSKPGSVAAKLHGANAVMSDAAKAKAPDAKVAPKAGPAGAAQAGGGAAPGGDDGGDLKQMLDAAAQEAASAPDPEIQQAMQSEPPQEGTPPSWAADADKWTKAEAAVKPHWTEYPDPFIVVATLYKKLGGAVSAGGSAAPAAGAV